MGNLFSRNEFPIDGHTIVVTGGSRGMGFEVARQLAERGAHVVIVARNAEKLQLGVDYMKDGAVKPQSQRFHMISADLSVPTESARVINEVVTWNRGIPPDTVWCCAGSSYPTLFVDTPVSQFQDQMNSNYFTSLYMAHATLLCWLKGNKDTSASTELKHTTERGVSSPRQSQRHIIFTASFVSFYSFAGYSPYSPAKAALRNLSDTLSQEMNLYATAHPGEPRVRFHTIFPGTILTESYDEENRIKTDLTKLLEGSDEGQKPSVVAAKSIEGLERGQELITTNLLTALVKRGVLGGSVRGGIVPALGDWILAWVLGIVMVFVRHDMDQKTRSWGRNYGPSGMK
ncbi:NAD(P)-binding protein [Xylariaceae sp. FL1019]|nr:NAD(P)-binding protein [Xylariaceae sp. FL1019]